MQVQGVRYLSPEICGNQSKQNYMKHWISKASGTRPIGDIALMSNHTRVTADEKMPIRINLAVHVYLNFL